jgi:hypothetical protein
LAVEPRGLVTRYTPRLTRQKWIALGVLGGHDKGLRLSMDLLARRAWALGVAASASGEGRGDGDGGAVAYVAWTRRLGPLAVRAQVGIGLGTRDGHRGGGHGGGRERDDDVIARATTDPIEDDDDDDHHRGGRGPKLSRRAEAALLFRLPLGKRLGLVGGPVLTASDRDGDRHDRHDGERRDGERRDGKRGDGDRGGDHGRGHVEKSMFVGLSYRF